PAGLARVLSVHASAIRQTESGLGALSLLEAALATVAVTEPEGPLPEWVDPDETRFRALYKLAQMSSEAHQWDRGEEVCEELLRLAGEAPSQRRYLALMASCYLAKDRGDLPSAHDFASAAGEIRSQVGGREGLRF